MTDNAPKAKFYNADEVLIYFLGTQIQGFAEDSAIKVEQMAPGFTSVVGVDGEVTRSKSNDRRAKVTVSLMQTSESNAPLSSAHNSDLNSPNGAGVGAFLMQDLSGFSVVGGAKAWITKFPDAEMKRTAGPREWEIEVAWAERTEGGN